MAFSFSAFNEKIKDLDPDIRQMALYDLHTELCKESFNADDSTQKTIVESVLRMLDDNINEVQGIAVKCLTPLVKKIKEVHAERLVTCLSTTSLKAAQHEKRDIACMALKTVVAEIPQDYSAAVKRLTSPLVLGLEKAEEDVKLEVLDVINDVLKRFGSVVSEDHARLQDTLLRELGSPRLPLRKKAIVCLASLCMFTNEALFNTVVRTVLGGIETNQGENLRKYIQCCSAVSRTAGQRLGKFLERIIPLLVKHVGGGHFSEEEGDEVRENIIQAFESFVLRCPGQVAQFFQQIVNVCKEFLKWDPNYTYEEEDDANMETDEADEDEVGDDEDMEQDEEDDISWKVRKASAKCLSAIIHTRPDLLDYLYQNLCSQAEPTLPDRFKEREESVKLDIFKVFESLLQASKFIQPNTREDENITLSSSYRVRVQPKPEVRYLIDVKPKIMKELKKCLKDKSHKIKAGSFAILKELCPLLGSHLEPDVPFLIAAVKDALTDKSSSASALKSEVLTFLRLLLVSIPNPACFRDHIAVLCPAVFTCISDRYYKIIAEALRVCGELVKVIRSLPAPAAKERTKALFDCVFSRLSTQDIDQDVKESAITTIGRILSVSGTLLSAEDIKKTHVLLLQLLNNEMSRLTTIKTLSTLQSDVAIDQTILNSYLTEMCGFLRKSHRPLRQASLSTLRHLVQTQSDKVAPELHIKILEELSQLLNDQDLHLSYLALELSTAIVSVHPPSVKTVENSVLNRVVILLKSPLLQGHALESVLALFETLSHHSTIGYTGLILKVLEATTGGPFSKQVVNSVAQVTATLCINTKEENRDSTIRKYCDQLGSRREEEVILALSCLGEIGRQTDLSKYGNLTNGIRSHFDSPNEEIKSVASVALGRVSAGNPQRYLPQVLQDIQSNQHHRYLTLRCLKEMILVSSGPVPVLVSQFPQILPLLFQYTESQEEGVRNVVAECLGKMALMDPKYVLSELKAHYQRGGDHLNRATIITALKYTVVEQPQNIDAFLRVDIKDFLIASFDKKESVKIRRAAVLLLTAAAHNKPILIRDDLQNYMPSLYSETIIDKSLIREVNLGPFKHKVDDGLELRKAAFECMDILLDNTSAASLLEYLNDYGTFIANVMNGLKDENQDIKMLAHLMLSKLSKIPHAVVPLLTAMEDVSTALGDTLTKKLKQNPVQQEKERHEELLKSALKATESLTQIKGSLDVVKFNDLYNKTIKGDKELRELLERIQRDAEKSDE